MLDAPVFAVQHHPEAGPGPHDAALPVRRVHRADDRSRRESLPVPKRTDLETILIIGSGPIVIGQACEFDYSGTQACRVLRDEGYRVVLVNSNPATIMTDPEFADATYVEPLDVAEPDPHHRAGAARRAAPDARRPDRAQPRDRAARGRRARRVRRRAHRRQRRGDPHRRGPPRVQGRDGGDRARACRSSGLAYTLDEADGDRARRSATRSSAGRRSSSAAAAPASRTTPTRCARVAAHGLAASPVSEILLEQSVVGWKEYELEVMRDHADNVVVICSIENFDAMGVHTGDSITVAPAQTLTDVEYQRMRDAAFACIRRIGVDTGGSNIQFALNPANGDDGRHRDEPARVALAARSRARPPGSRSPRSRRGSRSGTGSTRSSTTSPARRRRAFEPTIDYVVTKVPRWAFEKLPGRVAGARHDDAVGRRGDGDRAHVPRVAPEGAALARDGPRRASTATRPSASTTRRHRDRRARAHGRRRRRRSGSFLVDAALRRGVSVERLHEATGIDPWFLDQMPRSSTSARVARGASASTTSTGATGGGRSGSASATRSSPTSGASTRGDVFATRGVAAGVDVTYKTVDTCAAEFAARTPYHYGTYEDEDEVAPLDPARGRDPRQRARTASARASSSTTAACTPRSRSPTPASRP